ncbi:MAG: polyprenyl diphosphate synthase [Patescibacteria group bacterium]
MQNNLPQHVAIIPDGNRRWAKTRGLPVWEGHGTGVKRFVEIANAIFDLGIPYLTFWAASADNLTKRSNVEVQFLVALLRNQLRLGLAPFDEKNIKLRVIGRGEEIIGDAGLSRDISGFEASTARSCKCNLTIAFGYDGIEEMVSAMKEIAANCVWSNQHPHATLDYKKYIRDTKLINKSVITDNLWTQGLPSVDLLIRTGEMEPDWAHNSAGFMMMLTANSELYFPKLFWPDFTKFELNKALDGYAKRRRLLGG